MYFRHPYISCASGAAPKNGAAGAPEAAAADAPVGGGYHPFSLRGLGTSFLKAMRAFVFPKGNVHHGSHEQAFQGGGEASEWSQLNNDAFPLAYCERINNGTKFGTPCSPTSTLSCKGTNRHAGWTSSGARAFLSFNSVNWEFAAGVDSITFATFTAVADEKAVQNGGATTTRTKCEAIEANTVRFLNDNRMFVPLIVLIAVSINGSENFESQLIPGSMFLLGTIVSFQGKSKSKLTFTAAVVTTLSLMTQSLEEDKHAHGTLESIQPSKTFLDGVHAAAFSLISNSSLDDENTFTIPKMPGVSVPRPITGNTPRPGRPKGADPKAVIIKVKEKDVGSTALIVRRDEARTLSSESSTKKQRVAMQHATTGSAGNSGDGGGGGSKANRYENYCPIQVTPGDLLQFIKDKAVHEATTAANAKHQEEMAILRKDQDEKIAAFNAAMIQGEQAKTQIVEKLSDARVQELKACNELVFTSTLSAVQRAYEFQASIPGSCSSSALNCGRLSLSPTASFSPAEFKADLDSQMAEAKRLREAAKKFREQAQGCEYPDLQQKLLEKATANEETASKIVNDM